jgi:beta-glucuronidase
LRSNLKAKQYRKEENEMNELYPQASAARRVIDLSGMWKFKFDAESAGREQGWAGGLNEVMDMPVPASFADFFTDKASREYTGDFWYEREVFIPAEWESFDLFLRFEGAAHRAVVFVNGTEAGSHEGGFLPFNVNLNGLVRFDKPNRVSVLVNNELFEDKLPVGRTVKLPNGRKMAKGYFDFFNYSGLQRPVKLVALPKERILDYSVTHAISDGFAEVTYSVVTNGASTVTVTVFDEEGRQVAESEGQSGVIGIDRVRLWEVRNAYLYKFVFRITKDGVILDEYADDIGIRTFEIIGNEFLLNNKPVYLKGFGKHEDSDVAGRGLNLNLVQRDFELMKWIGANSFRTSHYPYSEEIYRLADREGFLVIDEVAAVGMMTSTLNFFDAAAGPRTFFFQKESTQNLLTEHLRQLEELIARDKNHACVVAWCLANEPETTDDSAFAYFEKVFEKARELDPQKRPRTFTSLMLATPDKCKAYPLCDFISLNRYYGWYVMGGNEIGTAEAMLRGELDQWAQAVENKPFIFSEYGTDTDAAMHKLPSVMWSQEYQREYLEMSGRVFDSYPFIRGEQVWTFADFQTGEGIMRVNGNKKGVFTRDRQPKDAAYLLKQRWENFSKEDAQ